MEYVLVYEENQDGLWGHFPDIKGVFTHGKNLRDLKKNGQTVLGMYFHDHLIKMKAQKSYLGLPVPSKSEEQQAIMVSVPASQLLPIYLYRDRLSQHKSASEVADLAGIKQSSYSKIESGKCANITVDMLQRLEMATGRRYLNI